MYKLVIVLTSLSIIRRVGNQYIVLYEKLHSHLSSSEDNSIELPRIVLSRYRVPKYSLELPKN